MPGRLAIQASATWAGVAPSRFATLSTASSTAQPLSFMNCCWTPPARPLLGSSWPFWYLPVKKPEASA